MLIKCVNHDKGKYVFLAIAIIIIAIIIVDILKLQIFKVELVFQQKNNSV